MSNSNRAALLSAAALAATLPDMEPVAVSGSSGEMPGAAADWRENFARLADTTAASPLPTRQLRRMAARALARTLSHVQGNQERKQRKLTKKRNRALAAAEKHKNGSGTAE
jgi:hypothetical protein